ncbi:MAG: TetR/AcrR family transcriptional regulator [Pirellulaceae bacterium]
MAENNQFKLAKAVHELVLERGYSGTSVDSICEKAGVSKGSFFHHFKSKEDAACFALDAWMSAMKEMALASEYETKSTPRERLLSYLDFLAGVMESPEAPKGCLLGSLALEVSQTHHQVQSKASNYFRFWAEGIANLIGDALGADSLEESTSLANHLISSLEGAILLAKATGNPPLVRSSILHFKQYIESRLV